MTDVSLVSRREEFDFKSGDGEVEVPLARHKLPTAAILMIQQRHCVWCGVDRKVCFPDSLPPFIVSRVLLSLPFLGTVPEISTPPFSIENI
jgi:hypothetical protein